MADAKQGLLSAGEPLLCHRCEAKGAIPGCPWCRGRQEALALGRASREPAHAAGRPGDNWLSGQARDIEAEQVGVPPWKRVPPLEPSVTDRPLLCPACDAGEPERCAVSSSHPCCWEQSVYDRGHAAGAAQRSREVADGEAERVRQLMLSAAQRAATAKELWAELVTLQTAPGTFTDEQRDGYCIARLAAAISAAEAGAGDGGERG